MSPFIPARALYLLGVRKFKEELMIVRYFWGKIYCLSMLKCAVGLGMHSCWRFYQFPFHGQWLWNFPMISLPYLLINSFFKLKQRYFTKKGIIILIKCTSNTCSCLYFKHEKLLKICQLYLVGYFANIQICKW